jgi:hypothetical protein
MTGECPVCRRTNNRIVKADKVVKVQKVYSGMG